MPVIEKGHGDEKSKAVCDGLRRQSDLLKYDVLTFQPTPTLLRSEAPTRAMMMSGDYPMASRRETRLGHT